MPGLSIYLLIGFICSRVAIVKNHDVIWDDEGVHTILMTVFWFPFLCVVIIYYAFKLIAKVIDPVIRKF